MKVRDRRLRRRDYSNFNNNTISSRRHANNNNNFETYSERHHNNSRNSSSRYYQLYPDPYYTYSHSRYGSYSHRNSHYSNSAHHNYSALTPTPAASTSTSKTTHQQRQINSSVINSSPIDTTNTDNTNLISSSNSNADTLVFTDNLPTAVSPSKKESSAQHSRNPSSISAISLHTRNLSSISAISLQEYWSKSPSPPGTTFLSERTVKHPSQSIHNHPYFETGESSSFPYHPKPPRNKLVHPLLSEDREVIATKSTFPNSAIKSPDRSKHREKNVSFLEYPLERIYEDHSLRNIPKVTPQRTSKMQDGSHYSERVKREEEHDIASNRRKHVISSGSNGVEVALKNDPEKPYSMLLRSDQSSSSTSGGKKKESDGNKNDTPPRDNTAEKGKKVTVITPQEGQNHGHHRSPNHHGHSRSPSYNTVDFHNDLPSVPDSPYSPFHPPGYPYPTTHPPSFQGFPSPNKAVVKSPRKERTTEDHAAHYPYSPHYAYPYPPPSFEEGYREMSPGKRQRVGAEAMEGDTYAQREGYANYPEAEHYNQEAYHRQFNRPGARDFYSESFDSENAMDRMKYPGAVPPVSKTSSYPPPSSPSRWGGPTESSANSYPGAHPRSNEIAADYANGIGASLHQGYRASGPPQPPPRYAYEYHDGYYPDQHRSRHHEMPASAHSRPTHPGYYYHEAPPPHDEVHPLLRDYDPERDRRPDPVPSPIEEKESDEKQLSPDRSHAKDSESVSTTPSLKSRNSKAVSPNKHKPSTAAKAAIAAGMTQPQAASEIDFDIHTPPLEPVIPPSKEAVCSLTSNVNNDDVLCGRGGGTNTQIGNRKFRALVQEFQPTYLLCRRKEKPLIARTIVLIIRNRGGRFLKKNEGNGMLYEVGDVKAEAKTSQALREGLDVRASKSTTIMGRKQKRAAEKKKQKHTETFYSGSKARPRTDDMTMAESPMRSQRDPPPPPQHDYSQYPPHPYYYGYGAQYPPYHYGYDPNPAYSSPSRKRQRTPQAESIYYPPAPYGHKGGYASYPYPSDYHYPSYPQPTVPNSETGEESAMWETDFNPPRGLTKKEDTRVNGE